MSDKLYLVSPNSAESGTLETLPVTANLLYLKGTLFDYKEQLAFGVFCIEETKSNLENY